VQSATDVQSTFLDMSRSTTAGHFPHSVLELHRAEAINSASQREAHLPAAPVKTVSRKSSSLTGSRGAHDNIPDDSSPNADAEADLISKFEDRIRGIPCPEVAVVDAEHTPSQDNMLRLPTESCVHHLSWLVGDLHSCVSYVSHGDAVPVAETHPRLDDVARIPVQQYHLDC
jgi:hypothetical protein